MHEIRLEKARVEYVVYDHRSRSLRELLLLNPVRRAARTAGLVGGPLSVDTSGNTVVRAIDDINLHLTDGDRVGLIGHNGAGKTTMLRLMAGIYEPVAGEVTVNGKVTSIFGMTDGMDLDATGYETIRLRSLVLGRSSKDINETAQQIADFTDLADYLYMPLRTYSSGMLVRLAFAIATSLQPEILLMDEIIGAGDAAFIDRAETRLKSFIESSIVMVVATHNVEILRKWCNKAILLGHGKVLAQGDVESVIAAHHREVFGGVDASVKPA